MARGMVKPIVFLATEPIVQVFALYMAVLYGVLYLSLTSKAFTCEIVKIISWAFEQHLLRSLLAFMAKRLELQAYTILQLR